MNTDEISRADSEREVLEQHMDGLNIQSAQPDRTVQDRPSWYARDADGQGEEAGDTQGVGIKSDNRRWVMPGDPDEPIEDPILSTIFPTPPELDLLLLKENIQQNGVRDAVVAWKGKGTIVDGHNRSRICKELGIPYPVIEMEFEDINAAKTWMVKNQLGRRNLTPFMKVEMVMVLRESFVEEGRKHLGRPKKGEKSFSDLRNFSGAINTEKSLAAIVGISQGGFFHAKWLMENAASRTKDDLRTGNLSIDRAYSVTRWVLKEADEATRRRVFTGELTVQEFAEEQKKAKELKEKKEGEKNSETTETGPSDQQEPWDEEDAGIDAEGGREDDSAHIRETEAGHNDPADECHDSRSTHDSRKTEVHARPIFPGYGLVSELEPTPEGVRLPAPDAGDADKQINTFGGSPADDLEFREAAEFQYVRSETKRILGFFTNRISGIINDISAVAATEENMTELMSILDGGFSELKNQIRQRMTLNND